MTVERKERRGRKEETRRATTLPDCKKPVPSSNVKERLLLSGSGSCQLELYCSHTGGDCFCGFPCSGGGGHPC